MCALSGGPLQKGINVRFKGARTILLMSQRPNAPYPDKYDLEKNVLNYVGHDVRTTEQTPFPKKVDQPLLNERGRPSENAKLIELVNKHKKGDSAETVQIFEKIHSGIWADKGLFALVDYRSEKENSRSIFVFLLRPLKGKASEVVASDFEHTRLIPTDVKVAVWKRDKGQCVICGAKTNLQYDHDLPFSKGGTSLSVENVRILCLKCNLKKRNKIE